MATERRGRRGRRSPETVLARIVTHVLDHAEREGLDRNVLLDAVGLRAEDLVDPDGRVPHSSLVALWQVLAKAPATAGFGLRSGAALRARDFGLLGYAVYFSPNLGAALRRIVRYSRIVTDVLQFELTKAAPNQVAVAQTHRGLGVGLPFAVDSWLATVVGVSREITGAEIVPLQVTFTYPEPASTAEHRRFFGCPIRFSQPVSRIVLREPDLALPVVHGDEALAGYLSQYAERVLRTLTGGSTVRDQVRSVVWALLSEGRPTLARVAAELGLPPRTLQRDLANEGTSLRAEIEQVRKMLATAVLRGGGAPIEEVAFVLGYSEASTFYRSVKRWTGKTPHQYRTEAA